MGLAQSVRAHLQGLSRGKNFSPAEVAGALGLPNAIKVRDVFHDFMKRSEIKRVGPGRYRYSGVKLHRERPREIKARLYRAMHIRGIFSARQIAMLADADKHYAQKLIRQLVRAGDVEVAGKEKTHRGTIERTYRVRRRDAFYLEYVAPGKTRRLEKPKDQEVTP